MMAPIGTTAPASPLLAGACQAKTRWATPWLQAIGLLVVATLSGCASQGEWVSVRPMPRNPLAQTLQLVSRNGPRATPRTEQLLRRYDLDSGYRGNVPAVLAQLLELQQREPSREMQYAITELAYIAAQQAEKRHDSALALSYYGTSLLHSYAYLFDKEQPEAINPYDPQFRGVCDLYNQSLESSLRLVLARGDLRPGSQLQVATASQDCVLEVVLHSSGWHDEDVDRLQFVSDYQLTGLRNHYHTYGLGVPLIAQRCCHEGQAQAEQFYPDQLTFPLTAFLRIETPPDPAAQPRFVLELRDPLDRQMLQVAGHQVPLESDLSTPLAYFLNQPHVDASSLSTLGLLNPDRIEPLQGLYMMEPFDPQKMPVVMVHGLWSTPITWMEMFNDLRSDPLLRDHYQFWFYLYPTGQPFWISATQMRKDLIAARQEIDPQRRLPALDQTVLVGHSMGGLLSKLQSVDSGDQFWDKMSGQPFAALNAEPERKTELQQAFFFQPSASVRRVVTIGTPHRGSKFANDVTRWLGRSLIRMPMKLMQGREELLVRNHDFFRPNAPIHITTSLDSLDPQSTMLTTLRAAEPAPWVSYHNILGQQEQSGLYAIFGKEGDGVVSVESASIDDLPRVKSQLVVDADHVSVHRHPQSVLEVRRVLMEQLAELRDWPSYQPGISDPEIQTVSHQNHSPAAYTAGNQSRGSLPQGNERFPHAGPSRSAPTPAAIHSTR